MILLTSKEMSYGYTHFADFSRLLHFGIPARFEPRIDIFYVAYVCGVVARATLCIRVSFLYDTNNDTKLYAFCKNGHTVN